MKLIVAGGRDLCQPAHVEAVEQALILALDGLHVRRGDPLEIVSGGATGIDALGVQWAIRNGVAYRTFDADWTAHGLKAGPIRNRQMAAYADFAVVVWNGKSRGSKDCLKAMAEHGKPALSWVVRE